MDGVLWVWIVIGVVVVIAIIVIIAVTTRGRREAQNRERAGELRSRAAENDSLLANRQERTEGLEKEADEARRTAMTEAERADSLRKQAGRSDEEAARAAEGAELLDDEVRHSREDLDKAAEERDKLMREADRHDPEVRTDRHGNRVQSDDGHGGATVAKKGQRADVDDEHDRHDARSDSHSTHHDDGHRRGADDAVVIPQEERLDVGDDYSGDEFADPDSEYIDPVEHDRLAQLGEEPSAATSPDEPPAGAVPARGRHADLISSEDVMDDDLPRDDEGRRLDPYGNPVAGAPVARDTSPEHTQDDVPRDEQGRRLDPYGNPVAEDRDL